MKEVMVVLRPDRYFQTKQALSEHRFFAMSSTHVVGRGRAHVEMSSCDGKAADPAVYRDMLFAKKMIDLVVSDESVDELVRVILSVNSTGQNGDGKIFILPVEDSVRVHTGERGEDAIL